MAKIDFATVDGTALGNPDVGRYFIFLDSSNSDRLTKRDSAGVDTVYTSGAIPTVLNDLTDTFVPSPSEGDLLEFSVSSGNIWLNRPKPVFGTEAQVWTNDALVTNTNSGADLDVLNVTTTSLPVGTYQLQISANVSCDSTNSDGIVNLTFDGNPITPTTGNNEIYRLEFKEAGGDNPTGAGTNQKDTLSFIYPVVVSVAGTKDIILSIITEIGGVEMNMWNASITLFRII